MRVWRASPQPFGKSRLDLPGETGGAMPLSGQTLDLVSSVSVVSVLPDPTNGAALRPFPPARPTRRPASVRRMTPGPLVAAPLDAALARIRAWGEARDWAGADPYDGLNSPLAPVLSLGTPLGRRVLTQ